MAAVSIDRAFERSLAVAKNVTLTVTQAPECAADLLGMLEGAMMRGRRNHTRLMQIELPFERYPNMDSKFWHIPVEDSGDAHVLRFFFETPQNAE